MRAVQYRILTNVLNHVEVPEYIYAFEKGRNIPVMAESHVGKTVVISLDLKDFFTSIKQSHLLELFTNLGFGVKPATTLSELCTYQSFVPQGALTSPKVSNIVTAFTFGPLLKQYCDERGLTLTIYADDITISTDQEVGRDFVVETISYVTQLVKTYGFRVNRQKTKVMRPHQRQYVCGVVVNQRVNLQKTERNKLRAIVHNAEFNGVAAEAAKMGVTPEEFASKVMGRLNWFGQLNPEAGVRLKSTFREILLNERIGQSEAVVESAGISNTVPFSEATSESVPV